MKVRFKRFYFGPDGKSYPAEAAGVEVSDDLELPSDAEVWVDGDWVPAKDLTKGQRNAAKSATSRPAVKESRSDRPQGARAAESEQDGTPQGIPQKTSTPPPPPESSDPSDPEPGDEKKGDPEPRKGTTKLGL